MTRFTDRQDAGRQLAQKLSSYKNKLNTVVIGLPRGGVVTAYEIAHALNLPLDIVVSRKIGAPFNPELAVGALTQEGDVHLNRSLMRSLKIKKEDLKQIIEDEKKEAQRRLKKYRGDRKPLELTDKTVIVVDDGIATGATMKSTIASIRKQKPKEIVVAVPVLPSEVLASIAKDVDKVVSLCVADDFMAVGQYYESFPQTTDEEVITLLSEK